MGDESGSNALLAPRLVDGIEDADEEEEGKW